MSAERRAGKSTRSTQQNSREGSNATRVDVFDASRRLGVLRALASSSPTTTMSEDAEATRKAAQAARQAKLQAKAQERLAKITGAAPAGRVPTDGELPRAAHALLTLTSCGPAAAIGITPRPAATPAAAAHGATPAPPRSLAAEDDDDPAEIDLAASHGPQAISPFAFGAAGEGLGEGFPGMPGMGGAGGDDMFAQMLAQMTGGGGAGGAAGGMGGMFGGPAGAEGMGGPMGNPFAAPPTSPFPPRPKTLLDRIFPLIHLLSMVGLVVYAVGWMEPTRKAGAYGWLGQGGSVDWRAWGALAGRKPVEVLQGAVGKAAGVGLADVVSGLAEERTRVDRADSKLVSAPSSLFSGSSSPSNSCCRRVDSCLPGYAARCILCRHSD